MTEIEKELSKVKSRIAACRDDIRTHQLKISLLDGEIRGLEVAVDSLQSLMHKEQP